MNRTTLRVIDGDTVRALLPYRACIDVIREAMIATSAGQAVLPLRQGMPLPGGAGTLGMMPGYLGEPACFGIKLVSLFPGNKARSLSSHLGVYVLYEARTGLPVALMNAGELTAIRTASATAVATQALMNPSATTLAILGTGEQARAHVEALLAVHPFQDIRIWGRDRLHAQALASAVRSRCGAARGIVVSDVSSVAEAVTRADVVCTVTAARNPILSGSMIGDGTHVNLVGSSFPEAREIDDDGVERARFFVDYRASALAQAGELLGAIRAKRVTAEHIVAEIGEVLSGRVAGRVTPRDVTIYKSLGIASQDLASAWYVHQAAERSNAGTLAPI